MKIIATILPILLFVVPVLHAQTDYRPGFIIHNNGDTIYGEIDYRGDVTMSTICRFKDPSNTVIEYSPADIGGFRFTGGKYYISKDVGQKTLFLEYLIAGLVNIYYARDTEGDHYYIDKDHYSLEEIPYEESIKDIDDKKYFYSSTRHIGFLTVFMQDAPQLKSEIDNIKKPDHYNLVKLAENYNDLLCKGTPCIIFEKKLPLMRLAAEPVFGFSKLKGYDKFLHEYGANFYIWSPRANEKLYFKLGLVGWKFSGEDKLLVYKIPLQIQYMYPAWAIKPKIAFGYNLWLIHTLGQTSPLHTLCLNGGVNISLNRQIALSLTAQTEYIPISYTLMNKEKHIGIASYSIHMGVYVEL